MHSDDSKLTLADRLNIFMGKMATRSDIKVTEHSKLADKVTKWKDILPEDMFEFYSQRNGIIFSYEVKGSSTTGTICILGFDSNGRGVNKPTQNHRSISVSPYQQASKFGEYFLDESSTVGPDDDVLFWFGDMSGWGILMVGAGESATFYTWDNDGFTKPMSTQSFTEIIERGLERSFVHTWQYDEHPLLEEYLAPLKIENPPIRTPIQVTVEAVNNLDARAWRAYLVEKIQEHNGNRNTLLDLIGLKKKASVEEQIEAFETYCSQDPKEIKGADIKALAKACTNKTSKKAFVDHFKLGQEFDWQKIDLRFDVKGVKKGAYIDNSFLMRVMASIDVLRPFVESYEGHIDVLRYTSDTSVATYWPYLIRAGIKEEAKGVFTTAWIREGHENFELGTYTSDALISTTDFTAYTK